MKHRGVWAWMTGLVWVCAGAWAGPISNMTFEEAVAKSKEEGGWLLVAPFSPECGTCEFSLDELMVTPQGKRWTHEGGRIVRVNVRADLEAAQALHVGQMPAFIAFKDGVEVDRAGGEVFRGEDAQTWLVQLMNGERRHARLLEEARDRGEKGVDIARRQRLAEELVQAGEYGLAREEYVWLWRNMTKHAPATVGVRGSFMASRMEDLAELDRASWEAFCSLRDEAEAELKGDAGSWTALEDWIALNDVVGDEDRTLAWFDRVKDTPAGRATIARVRYRIDELLKRRDSWAELVVAYPNPLEELRQHKALHEMAGAPRHIVVDPRTGEEVDWAELSFRKQCADVYAAYLAAGLDEDAGKIAGLARELDGSPKMIVALVEKALEIGQERAEHLEMLEAARALGADVAALDAAVRSALKRRS